MSPTSSLTCGIDQIFCGPLENGKKKPRGQFQALTRAKAKADRPGITTPLFKTNELTTWEFNCFIVVVK